MINILSMATLTEENVHKGLFIQAMVYPRNKKSRHLDFCRVFLEDVWLFIQPAFLESMWDDRQNILKEKTHNLSSLFLCGYYGYNRGESSLPSQDRKKKVSLLSFSFLSTCVDSLLKNVWLEQGLYSNKVGHRMVPG